MTETNQKQSEKKVCVISPEGIDDPEKMLQDGFKIMPTMCQNASWGSLSLKQQQDIEEVVRLWEGAAEKGNANAQYNLGIMYDQGHGVDVNFSKAIKWYEKAAEQGHAKAQERIKEIIANRHE